MSKLNPQNATAYVGPGVLKQGGKTTKVPNGPLIKKKGVFKGSTLKSGGKLKKAMMGSIFKNNPIYKMTTDLRGSIGNMMGIPGKPIVKNGSRIKKAQGGEYLTKEGNKYTATKKVKTKNGPRYYQGSSPSMSFARELASDKARKINDSIPKAKLSARALEVMNNKNGGTMKKKAQQGVKIGKLTLTTTPAKNDTIKKPKMVYVRHTSQDTTSAPKVTASNRMNNIINQANKKKAGGLIKRADGSYSKRGLWDNIRANKGSGKKPTKQMLQQEKKIKAKSKK